MALLPLVKCNSQMLIGSQNKTDVRFMLVLNFLITRFNKLVCGLTRTESVPLMEFG